MKILKKVKIKPCLLNRVHEYISSVLYKQMIGECSSEYGYILKINDYDIIDNCITQTNSDIILDVIFDIDNFKPEVGSIYKSKIFAVYDAGIFVDVFNYQKVLIPMHFLSDDFIYNECLQRIESKGGDKFYTKDMYIDIVIKGIKYVNGKFNCFGSTVI